MKFSEQWLREWENPDLDTDALAEQLSMQGLEVDSATPAAAKFTHVVVGEVVERHQHPNADKLSCCQVNVGEGEPLSIVCGAQNVRQGLKVAVAKVGAVLGDDFKIKKAKLRGEPSFGMICSEKELGLAEQSNGIMELPADAPIGVDVREYLSLDDHIIDIDITPNRGDCLSIRGIARDNAMFNHLTLNTPKIADIKATIKDEKNITLQAPEACPRYVGRVIRNINSNAVTPLWMQERLRRSGIRCIHPVVDVGNYVMIEWGQPMHAFDLDRLSGDIVVRRAKKDEPIALLDEQNIKLHPETLVIADDQGAQAVAGIMGGSASAVTEGTQNIFLESAYFNPVDITMAARAHELQSDSSFRFERGVDYELQRCAIERASELLIQIVGGEAGPMTEAVVAEYLPEAPSIHLRREQVSRHLGVSMDDARIESILTALGMSFESTDQGWQMRVPSFRSDIQLEIDIIEELARVYGYNAIEAQPMRADLKVSVPASTHISKQQIKMQLVSLGYHEVVSYSFVDASWQRLLEPDFEAIELSNPISSDMSVMRGSCWPGLLQAMQYNQNRQCHYQRLFELGQCFRVDGSEWSQQERLAMLAVGDALPEQWSVKNRPLDFYDLKGDVEQLLLSVGENTGFEWRNVENNVLHPGQSAGLYRKGQLVGYLGALHPKIAQQMDLNQVPFLFEVDVSAIDQTDLVKFSQISKFPAIRRDLAILVDQSQEVGTILQVIAENATNILNKIEIFDIYQGQGITQGKKSVALGLTFQDPARTLVDSEINDVIQKVVMTLERQFNATLRA